MTEGGPIGMGLNVAALRALTIDQIEEITGLRVQPGAQREGLLDDVREKILWTHQHGGWNEPSLRETSIADTANYLVPPKAPHRMTEFTMIRAAWEHVDLTAAESVAWTELAAVAGRALQLAYAHAVRTLLEWAETA